MSRSERKKPGVADRKYRPLKKLIKKDFQKLSTAADAGKLPASPLLDDFLAQAKAMVSYPGFGDDRYPVFLVSCEMLKEAHRQKDIKLFGERLAAISLIKKECHRLYKP